MTYFRGQEITPPKLLRIPPLHPISPTPPAGSLVGLEDVAGVGPAPSIATWERECAASLHRSRERRQQPAHRHPWPRRGEWLEALGLAIAFLTIMAILTLFLAAAAGVG